MTRERVAIAPVATDAATFESIVDRARRRGFRRFVVDTRTPFTPEVGEELLRRDGDRILVNESGAGPIPIVSVGDEAGLARAVREVAPGAVLVIEWSGDRVIPLENAVAARGRRFELWAYARSPAEVPAALGALEHGADHVIVEAHLPSDIDTLEAVVEGPLPAGLDWTLVPVTTVRPVGIGDRVIVDTTSLLTSAEGMLVGSAAAFLFHVASEAVGSKFSRPRPFRVNAGSAHSYVLMADGSTRYLAELGPGDAVLVTEPRARARSVRVGRIKIERRPLVVVATVDESVQRTIFLQEAETVRVSTENGRVATTELGAGARVFGVRLPAARHLGHAVEETIEER
ncbi:MAG: 3-dehydroquinate synthase II [Thermoplasmata archaeon]|jgi:3-dehydroquinate synthase II